jgi:hypothetical protein
LVLLFRLLRRFGTFAPACRASDKPIAMACLRLVTFLPERPLRSVPRLRSCIAFSTFFDAFLLYFLAMGSPSDNRVVHSQQHDPCQSSLYPLQSLAAREHDRRIARVTRLGSGS